MGHIRPGTGQPIYQLLGGKYRDRIQVYNTCAGYRYSAARTQQVALGHYQPLRKANTKTWKHFYTGRMSWRTASTPRDSAP